MTDKKSKVIISRYLNNEASELEIMQLVSWLEDEKKQEVFKNYLIVNHALDNELVFDSLAAYKKTMSKIAYPAPNSKVRYLNFLKYAAVIIVFISIGYFYLSKNNLDQTRPIVATSNIVVGSDKAILTLGNGTNITLDKNQSYAWGNAKSNGYELVYSPVTNEKMVNNYLTVPRAGKFLLQLSDGTKIWLNSESQIKFPNRFIKGHSRNVELLYGEAYFEVSPSKAHHGVHFKVKVKNQNIEVLGTKFNIKAYQDETTIITTLVEGKVELSNNKQVVQLLPNQQTVLNKVTNTIQTKSVEVTNETAWKDGEFSFKRKDLKEIMKTLSRWYDMEVVFEDENVMNKTFNGSLGKDQKIEEILETLKSIGVIKNYEIHAKKVILR